LDCDVAVNTGGQPSTCDAVAEQRTPRNAYQWFGDSEYIIIAQVGCLTADGNVDDVDLHRAPKYN